MSTSSPRTVNPDLITSVMYSISEMSNDDISGTTTDHSHSHGHDAYTSAAFSTWTLISPLIKTTTGHSMSRWPFEY